MVSKLVENLAESVNVKVDEHIGHLTDMAETGIRGADYVAKRAAELKKLAAQAHENGELPEELTNVLKF